MHLRVQHSTSGLQDATRTPSTILMDAGVDIHIDAQPARLNAVVVDHEVQ